MNVPPIKNEPCNCPPGQCAEMIDRDENCINRLPDATVLYCDGCGAYVWHSRGSCLRCPAKDGGQ